MKALSCVYMAFCLWGLWYVSTMMPMVSIHNIAAFMAVGCSTIEHVNRVFRNWFK